jgi:transcriptional regulator with XRE-family HTH domain
MDAQRRVGLNARKHRLTAGLTQEDIADRMGVDRSFVSGSSAASATSPSSPSQALRKRSA